MRKSHRKKPVEFPGAERVHQYARDVVSGKIDTYFMVWQACARHLDDLKNGHKRGLIWKPARAESGISFFEDVLFLSEDQPFKLDDFQAFCVGNLLGWWKEDADEPGTLIRRFRYFYGEMGKGNGKTPIAAGLALYFLVYQLDPSPEVYSAAAAKEQARICFDDAAQMVEWSPLLRGKIQVLKGSLTIQEKNARFLVLSSEAKSKHGKRVSCGVLDEIHAHNSAKVVRTITAGTKNCRNALIIMITNSGHDQRSICWKYHENARLVLSREIQKDDLFAFVCGLNPCKRCRELRRQQPDPKCKQCDDWRNPKNWPKANPGLGTICRRSYVAERVDLARTMPSELNDVLQLNLCQWTESAGGWANMSQWDNACRDEELEIDKFKGRRAWLGMDAANRVDVTSLVALLEREEGSGVLDLDQLDKAAREALRQSTARLAADATSPFNADDNVAASLQADAVRQLAAAGYVCFAFHFVPEDLVNNASQENHEAYKGWAEAGQLIVTPGAVTDFAAIAQKLRDLDALFKIQRLQYDPRELGYFMQRVQTWASFEVVEVNQSPALISQPMKELEALIAAGKIVHNGDPVLRWMVANVVQKTTSAGPVKFYFPTRPAEASKIDAAVALIMAIDSALRAPAEVGEPGMAML